MATGRIDERIAPLETLFTRAAHARQPQDVEWVLDAAFFVGRHYTEWNNHGKRFQEIPRKANESPDSPRPVANKIYSLTMDAYASAKSHDPAVEVAPTTSDAVDVSNAKVAQALLEDLTSPTKAAWEFRRNQALFWVALTGEAWLKWTMDLKTKLPRIQACSPLEVYCDPTPDNYLDARWIIHARGMDPDEVSDTFGVEMEGTDVDSQDVLKQKILREVGMVTGNPTVTVRELWELPSRRFKNGRHVIWTQSTVLLWEDFPYLHGMLPFTQLGHSPIPGTAHYMSGVRVARPANMELNQYHAQKIISRKKFSNHKWAIDSRVRESLNAMPDDSNDQVLVYDSDNGRLPAPQILQAQMWPDSQDGEWLNDELRDAIGLHEASQGQAPGRVDSAAGLEMLQEGDKGRLSEVEDTLTIAIARGFGMILSLMKQFVPEELMVPVYTRNGAVQVHKFKTSSLPDKPLMRVVSGGGLPKNRAARRQEVISMWSAGLLGVNPARALEMLDYPMEMNVTGDELDVLEALQENMQMLDGIACTPKPWQNHEIHRRVHDECRKSAEFASATTNVWDLFEFHDQATDTAELEDMRVEAERQRHIDQMLAEVNPPEVPPAAPDAPVDPSLMAGPTPPPTDQQPQPAGQGLQEAMPDAAPASPPDVPAA